MHGMLGADPEALRALGGRCSAHAATVAGARGICGSAVDGVRWLGADADAFRAAFSTTLERAGELETALAERAEELARQAADQDAASAAGGGTARAGGGMARAGGSAEARAAGAEAAIAPSELDAVMTDERLEQLAATGDPQAVADAFAALGYDPGDEAWIAAMAALGARSPELIGDLEGAPYVARDSANRLQLATDLAIRCEQLGVEGSVRDEVARLQLIIERNEQPLDSGIYAQRLQALQPLVEMERLLNERLAPGEYGAPQLIDYDLSADGRPLAAVSDRNLDTAREVTVIVPGMFSDAGTIPELIFAGANIRDQAERRQGLDPATHAVVAWANYTSPDLTTVRQNAHAIAGGERLGANLAGLDAARGESVETNLIAYSYGTTTSHWALAADPDAYGVDSVFYLGSAGLPGMDRTVYDDEWGRSTSEYAYGGAEMYASESSGDDVARWGRVGSEHPFDPASQWSTSGFTRFDTSPGVDAEGRHGTDTHDLGGALGPSPVRTGYLDAEGKAVAFIADRIGS